eukprot:scaffold19515_cov46-Phaeocystis_antarctica.AAC.1
MPASPMWLWLGLGSGLGLGLRLGLGLGLGFGSGLANLAKAKYLQRGHGSPRQGGREGGGAHRPQLRVAEAEARERGQAAAAEAGREQPDALVAVT